MGYLLRYQSEFTELAKSRFLDCDSCGMTQGALIRYVADRQALYMQAKQTRSDILYMTTLDTGRCSHYQTEKEDPKKLKQLTQFEKKMTADGNSGRGVPRNVACGKTQMAQRVSP